MSNKVIGDMIKILLVEDNSGDVRLVKEALKEGKIHVEMDVVQDGVEALAFLNQKESMQKHPGLT